jgi:hypothetical protein
MAPGAVDARRRQPLVDRIVFGHAFFMDNF